MVILIIQNKKRYGHQQEIIAEVELQYQEF
jgi:hypothetical protein